MYDLLAATISEDLSLIMGASTDNLLKMKPTPPLIFSFFLFHSFILTSKIDDSRPPYLDGIPPL